MATPDVMNKIITALMGVRAPVSSHAPNEPVVPMPSHVAQPSPTMDQRLEQIYQQYPPLRPLDISVVDSRGLRPDVRGGLEYYPKDELYNPTRGRRTIELFNPALAGAPLNDALAGDMLHGMPEIDPTFRAMRSEFYRTLTPEQLAFDRRSFEEDHAQGDTFESWMDRSRLDAYIRGYLFPDQNDEWRKSGVYTPAQQQLLERMRSYLRGGK